MDRQTAAVAAGTDLEECEECVETAGGKKSPEIKNASSRFLKKNVVFLLYMIYREQKSTQKNEYNGHSNIKTGFGFKNHKY